MNNSAIVKLSNVKKSFNNELVLKGINLNFKEGGFYSIIGRSGCGKSTLLRLINGLEIAEEGIISVDGIELNTSTEKQIRQNVGMVFQSFQLFTHMTLLENVSLPQQIVKKIDLEIANKNAKEYLEKVGLSEHLNKYPHQLSGGQQQRGAIARALALKPKIMLYDEPTSALDPELALEVHHVMKNIDHSITQIIVTHDLKFAKDISDEIIFMHRGLIEEIAVPAEIFSNPSSEATKDFLRNFV